MASCAWRLVPTNNTVRPCAANSPTKRLASRNIFRVFCRSMIWIPLRSPKIYSFIFGFQRRVWWPKCTPASSNSFIVISTANGPPLGLGACGPAPDCRAGESILLPAACRPCISPVRRAAKSLRLPLAELEALARALLPVLLALAHARIARQEAVLPQSRAQIGIEYRQRARKAHAYRAGLPAHATAVDRGHDVHLVAGVGKFQRLHGARQPRH